MSNTMFLDEGLAQNIALAAHTANTLVLTGDRQFDRFLLQADESTRTMSLERLCHEQLAAAATWLYEPYNTTVTLSIVESELTVDPQLLPKELGHTVAAPRPAKVGESRGLAAVIENFTKAISGDVSQRYVLFINAGMLVQDMTSPRDDDFDVISAIEYFSRAAVKNAYLVFRVAKPADLPARLLSSANLRTIHIPATTLDLRHRYVQQRGSELAAACGGKVDDLAEAVSTATEDWSLDQIDTLISTSERNATNSLQDVVEHSRAMRIGTTVSPWAGERIRSVVATAHTVLAQDVMGQPTAVKAVATALRQAAIGLSSAHQSQGSQAPRAVLFFAGPTGTGKTELSKAIARLVFGQPTLLRFDCGELQQEHAVGRLIGAPPGYVGHEQGGELTEGIRAKPNSVVLFDEIEKAHPKLLDTLLGVLDDGRLTSGQGETAYFGQSILIFTSNLGMYEEIPDDYGKTRRRARFGYDTPFADIESGVRDAIREEFTSKLGRPELLGRLDGAESIIVFDYLRELEKVCGKFIRNIVAECQRLHGITLDIDQSIIQQIVEGTRAQPDALVLGGRGLKPQLKKVLTNPLTDYLIDNHIQQQGLRVEYVDGEAKFHI